MSTAPRRLFDVFFGFLQLQAHEAVDFDISRLKDFD
jgi:hypothetical protein